MSQSGALDLKWTAAIRSKREKRTDGRNNAPGGGAMAEEGRAHGCWRLILALKSSVFDEESTGRAQRTHPEAKSRTKRAWRGPATRDDGDGAPMQVRRRLAQHRPRERTKEGDRQLRRSNAKLDTRL